MCKKKQSEYELFILLINQYGWHINLISAKTISIQHLFWRIVCHQHWQSITAKIRRSITAYLLALFTQPYFSPKQNERLERPHAHQAESRASPLLTTLVSSVPLAYHACLERPPCSPRLFLSVPLLTTLVSSVLTTHRITPFKQGFCTHYPSFSSTLTFEIKISIFYPNCL